MGYIAKRQTYGVVIDLLPAVGAEHGLYGKKLVRLNDLRKAVREAGYRGINSTAEELYMIKTQQQSQRALYAGEKSASVSGMRFHLLCSAQGLMAFTHSFKSVKLDILTALRNGTPVAIHCPLKTPDMYKPKSLAEFELLCEREANMEWAKWTDELDINLQATLNTETPWLNNGTLRDVASSYDSFELFMEFVQAQIHEIEADGEWDVDVSNSVVYNEKASVAKYVATKGMNKGQRDCKAQYKYANKEYWYNYEVLPVDVLTKYLHVTFLQSIEYKPLQRIVSDGADYGTRMFFEFCTDEDFDMEQGLTVTPLYEDPYFTHEGEEQQ